MDWEDGWKRLVTEGWANRDEPPSLLAYFEHLVSVHPNSGRARFELANVLDYLSREEEAVVVYREAINLGLSKEYEAYAKVQLASSLRNLGNADEAVRLLRDIVSRYPHHLSFVIFLALSLHSEGRSAEALQVLVQTILHECETPDLLRYHRSLTQYAAAIHDPRGNQTRDPSSLSIHPHSPQAPWPWDLLLLADPSRTRIQNYCRDGLCYVAQWHEEIVGVYVIALNTDGGAELMNIAVREDWQGQGLGQRLVQHAENTARNLGCLWLDVATGNSSLLQLRFYQRAGFRITDIVPDFFVLHYNQLIMENGIPCRDQIRLRKQLVADAP